MKYSIAIAIILILLAAGAAYVYAPSEESTGNELCAQVLTDARNSETGEIETFPTPCDVPEGWDVLETDPETFQKNGEEWTRYRNDDLGVRFEYRVEPSGYTLIEQPSGIVPNENIVEHVSLFNTEEYLELLGSSVPREGPPAISLLIFENPDGLTPAQWVETEKLVSNVGLAQSEPITTEVGSSPAVRYMIDGLYVSDVIVASNNNHMYLLAGSYSIEKSPIREDFLELIKYFSLY